MAGPQNSKHLYDSEEEHWRFDPFASSSNAYKQSPSSEYTVDDSYDPTNVGKPRANAENANASYYNDERHSSPKVLSYSDDGPNRHSQEQTIDESPGAPLVRSLSNNHKSRYQDLGVFQPLRVASSSCYLFS